MASRTQEEAGQYNTSDTGNNIRNMERFSFYRNAVFFSKRISYIPLICSLIQVFTSCSLQIAPIQIIDSLYHVLIYDMSIQVQQLPPLPLPSPPSGPTWAKRLPRLAGVQVTVAKGAALSKTRTKHIDL
jgi:hypothetical protein